MKRVIWFLLACLAGALAVIAWRSGPVTDPYADLPDPDQDYQPDPDDMDDLLHWCCTHDTAAPDDLSSLDGA